MSLFTSFMYYLLLFCIIYFFFVLFTSFLYYLLVKIFRKLQFPLILYSEISGNASVAAVSIYLFEINKN